jgi:hypothetical protein
MASPDFINSPYIPGASITPSMLSEYDDNRNPVELGEVLSADEVAAQGSSFWSGVSSAIKTGVEAAGQIIPMVSAWKIAKLNVQRAQLGQPAVATSTADIVPSYQPMVTGTSVAPVAAPAPARGAFGVPMPLLLAGGAVALFLLMGRRR